MVTVKQAAESAAAFATSTLGADRTAGMQLEEAELGKFMDRDAWRITLSMLRPNPFAANENVAGLGLNSSIMFAPRDYKTFFVDRETGEVLSMKIRELAHAE